MARKRPLRSSGTVVVLEHSRRSSRTTRWATRTCASSPCGCRRSTTRARRAAAAGASRCSSTWSASPARASRTSPGRPSATTCPSAPRASSHERKMGPAIIVFPDCFTALGGNQYVNSPAIGDYADYLTKEIMPFVDREFRTLASREHRGCFGKSSGGYGAIVHGMKYAQHWGADRGPLGRRVLRLRLPPRLAEHAERARQVPRPQAQAPGLRRRAPQAGRAGLAEGRDDGRVKPLPRGGVGEGEALHGRGPRDHEPLHGGDLRPRPAGAATASACPSTSRPASASRRAGSAGGATTRSTSSAKYRESLASLRGIYIDCGSRDQYHIHYGTRILSKRLAEAGIRHTLRGVRRQPLRHRLPDGREPAVPLQGAETLMRWGDFRRSDNVEDRGQGGGGGTPRLGGMRLTGGAIVVVVIASLLFGVNPLEMLAMLDRRRRAGDRAAARRPASPGPGCVAAGRARRNEGDGRARPRRHRGRLAAVFKTMGSRYDAAAARALPRRHAVGVRPRVGGGRARSTARRPARSISTPRSSTTCRAASAHRATSRRRTSSPTRSATTCRT